MKNLFLIFIGVIWISGCGKTLKEGWGNFRAYYNTYYNAKYDFQSGLYKVRKQPISLDPSKPVRVHPSPVPAATADFEEAISKSVKILRKFPGSKWVDDALLLIGKSYYYQQKFYQALQKFDELQDISQVPKIKQSAILWRGRTLLDLKQSENAVSFLEDKLRNNSDKWPKEKIAELQVLLAEHHAMLQNWKQSEYYLSQAVGKIKNKKMLGRTFFLYGQILQKMGRYGEAYRAFSNVEKHFPGFEYAYWAEIKRADVERKQGDFRSALAIYNQLLRDDKFFQRRKDVLFNIARTLEMQGEHLEAEKKYLMLLRKGNNALPRTSKADIYYRLGKINSTVFGDYSAAAAYFDSSSASGYTRTAQSDYSDARDLAQIFGEYNKLQHTINHADSLLWLGSLTSSVLDSVLKQIRAEKKHEKLSTINNSASTLENDIDTKRGADQLVNSDRYGFLNYRNAKLVSRVKAEFKRIWGNRSLTDNWRLQEVAHNVSDENDLPAVEATNPPILVSGKKSEGTVNRITIEEIPGTDQERQQLEAEKQTAQYELGSLLFLRLNAPKKAKYYFYKVIHDKPLEQALPPRAMYSLYEIYDAEGRQDSLTYWKDQILEGYPNSSFSRRIQLNRDATDSSMQSTDTNKLRQKYRKIVSSPHLYQASELRSIALSHRSSDIAPSIYYQAIKEYIQQAHALDAISNTLQSKLYNNTPDSTYYPEDQQFSNVYWDSARIALAAFDTTFSNTRLHQQIAVLRNALGNKKPSTCLKLGITLKVEPSMQDFLSTVQYPENVKNKALSGKVAYSFRVTNAGKIKSFRLISNQTTLGIEEAFERSFSQDLQFAPIVLPNVPDEIRCEVSFPIQH